MPSYEKHHPAIPDDSQLSFGDRAADAVRDSMGSWAFIIIQTIVCISWVFLNVGGWVWWHWDPYPFILLNLAFSVQAAYASPVILLSQKRSDQIASAIALHTYQNTLREKSQEAQLIKLLRKQHELILQVRKLTAEVHEHVCTEME